MSAASTLYLSIESYATLPLKRKKITLLDLKVGWLQMGGIRGLIQSERFLLNPLSPIFLLLPPPLPSHPSFSVTTVGSVVAMVPFFDRHVKKHHLWRDLLLAEQIDSLAPSVGQQRA